MFTPLAIHKNRIQELDRLNNSSVSTGTAAKRGGYGVPSQDNTQNANLDGTIVVQAWPNSDDVKTTTAGHQKYHLWTCEGTVLSTWWQLCIPTADNQLNVGAYTDYPGVLGSSGVLKGQIGVSFRQRQGGGINQDGIILFNSGSVYDWTNPQPITIAYSVDMTAGVGKASIDGQTATVLQADRSAAPGATDPLMFTNLTTSTVSAIAMTHGYSFVRFPQAIASGSVSQVLYYDSALNQDELNLITGQPWGEQLDILSKQPEFYYLITQEEKVQTSGNTITGQLNGVFAFENKGKSVAAGLSQLKSVSDTTGFTITSGSVFDTSTQDYRGRI